ncbi:DNA alkylation repair protein [Pseudonocardia sp. NPDC049635]|uniref:DNA alkylation repair protein n=1 Tax=Pseudonocardia sp. NPDC049635 TaxID=3155506 RepID=UPI0033F890B0
MCHGARTSSDRDRRDGRITDCREWLQVALSDFRSPAEKEKMVRRLPPESGLDAIGVRMKYVFDTAKEWWGIDRSHVPDMLSSPWCEIRMVGVSILDFKARSRGLHNDERRRLYGTYMAHRDLISIWDLVDRAAPRVIGRYLLDQSRRPLFELANSSRPIERRTAITAAFWLIREGDINDPLTLADIVVDDSSVLVTKPVGTALRVVEKVDQ